MYEGKIIVNEKTRCLHAEGCYYVTQRGEGYRTYQSLETALLESRQILHTCKRCLKGEVEIEKRVSVHNKKENESVHRVRSEKFTEDEEGS